MGDEDGRPREAHHAQFPNLLYTKTKKNLNLPHQC